MASASRIAVRVVVLVAALVAMLLSSVGTAQASEGLPSAFDRAPSASTCELHAVDVLGPSSAMVDRPMIAGDAEAQPIVPARPSGVCHPYAYDYRPDFARPPPIAPAADVYDSPAELADPAADGGRVRRASPGLGVEGVAPQSLARAESAADFARLTRQLQFDEAASVFKRSGGLQPSVINNSSPIIRGPQLGNQQVVKALTADGSNIADWAKYTTQTFQSPSGPFQVHFYRNSATGAVNYGYDHKVVFNGPR